MPEEWPIAAAAADQHAPARRAGRDRLSTVRTDFFLDPAEPPERAGAGADDGDAALPGRRCRRRAARGAARTWRRQRTTKAISLWSSCCRPPDCSTVPGSFALLLRRADEERIATGARSRAGRREARVVQGLVSHSDGAVAAAAMTLIIARGRRRDRFGQCLLHFDDLPARRGARAGLLARRCAAPRYRPRPAAPRRPTACSRPRCAQVLARHDPASSIEQLTAALVRLLDEEDALERRADRRRGRRRRDELRRPGACAAQRPCR